MKCIYLDLWAHPRWWVGTWWAEKIRNSLETRFWCLDTSCRCSSHPKDAETLSLAKWHLEVTCCFIDSSDGKGSCTVPSQYLEHSPSKRCTHPAQLGTHSQWGQRRVLCVAGLSSCGSDTCSTDSLQGTRTTRRYRP